MYIVVKMFDDLQDTKVEGGIRTYHRYNVGDEYPRAGYTPTTERVQSLLTGNNSLKVPLIGILEEEALKAPETAEEVKAEEQPTETEKAPKKAPATRKRAAPAKRKATPKKEG